MHKLPRAARPFIVVLAVALVFALCYFAISGLWKEEEPQYAPDITGVTQDGKTLASLSDGYGETGTLLIFFNWNTGNAIDAMQLIGEVAPDYDVNVMAVATGEGTIEEQLAKMKELEIPVLDQTLFDLEGEMAETYNVHGTPVLYFIDKNGQVQEAYIAVISEKSLRKNLEAIA